MYAIGHIALGYLAGKILSKATDQNSNTPILWTFSLLPDVDFIIPSLQHRGPTHSIIFTLLFFTPFLLIAFRKAAPYFAAMLTHFMIGDYITDKGVMMFWPLSLKFVKYQKTIPIGTSLEIQLELALFATLLVILIISKDLNHLLHYENKNLILLIPIFTIIIPAIYKYPIKIPTILLIPHMILLGIITLSLSISIINILTRLQSKTWRR